MDDHIITSHPDQADRPLLDLTGAAVRQMIRLAKQRGYVTHGELNKGLPPRDFSSEQIEDVLGQLSAMGISVVESEEVDEGQQAEAEEEEADGDNLVEASQSHRDRGA